MTEQEATKLVALVTGMWPRPEFTDPELTAWRMALADLDYNAAVSALKRLHRTLKFRPTVAELFEIALADDIDDRLPPFERCIDQLRAWVSRGRWAPGEPHELTVAAADGIGGLYAWRTAPDENYDPRGYQHTIRRMRETYDAARAQLRSRALQTDEAGRERLLGPKPTPRAPGRLSPAERARARKRLIAARDELAAELRQKEAEREADKHCKRTGPVGFGAARKLAKKERSR